MYQSKSITEDAVTNTSFIPGPSKATVSPIISEDEDQINWNPYESRLTLNFGTVGPSAGPWPWVLERKHAWNYKGWLSSAASGGDLRLLGQARIVRLILKEEFLFDTIDPNDRSTFGAYISAAHAHRSLTPWDDILAMMRSCFQYSGRELEVFEIHVQGLGSMSSMSDYGLGQEQNTTAVLRPTAGIYAEFIKEFTKFPPGMIGQVRLSGLFLGDWAGLIETRMPGTCVTKDLSEFMKEIRWWTLDGESLKDLEAQPESELRRRHAEARWAMLNGAGNDHDECDSDPGYESDGCLDTC